MAGGIGAATSGTGASNVVGTGGAPPPSGLAGLSTYGSGTGFPAADSTNTTTQQDMMGNRNAGAGMSGLGLNAIFNSMQQGLPTTQQTPVTTQQTPQMQPVPTQPENVASVYKSVLGREADPGGLAYWQGQVDKGMSLGDVAKAFSASDEYKNKPAQPTQPQPPQSPQQSPQQGQQGGKAGGFGQPQQNPYQPPSPVFMPQVNQDGGAPQPMQQQQQASPYQVQNPYQGMMQNSYNQMMNPYMQQQRATPYQQQFQQQYNPLSYKPNMTQSNASLSRVKPSVYTSDLATAQARVKELEDADAARIAAATPRND
jgi:hypothetical protein